MQCSYNNFQKVYHLKESLQCSFEFLASQLSNGELDDKVLAGGVGSYKQCNAEPQKQQMLQPVKVGNGENHFAEPKSDAKVEKLRRQGIPANTIKGTKWAQNVWRDWTGHRRSVCHPLDCPPHLYVCTKAQLSHWLSKFEVEVRRKDGKPYPPQSLYCCGLLRYVRDLRLEVNFFTDSEFRGFQQSLNAEMKRL